MALFTKAHSSRGKEDHKWLQDFSIIMIIWFTAVHTLAYAPAQIFGDAKDVWDALWGQM